MELGRLGSRLIVDLSLFKDNIKLLKDRFPHQEVIFMVKADAYGHGILEMVEFSLEECGIKEFGVASLSEALALRRSLPEKEFELYVFSDQGLSLQENHELYHQKRIFPVITKWSDLKIFCENPSLKSGPLCLKFNTGMNRLGLDFEEVDEVISYLKSKGIKDIHHLMSHFANASLSMKKNNRNLWQRDRFKKLKEEFKNAGFNIMNSSIGNSGALEQGIGGEETHIRPGLMLYGPSSMAPKNKNQTFWKGKIISRLETTILSLRPIKKGDPIGYGSVPCPSSGVLAIIAIGYGDGIGTKFSGAHLTHRGVQGQIVGRVCMDMTFVLFPEGTDLKEEENFIIWGSDPEFFRNLSQETSTIPYELVIALTTRVPRIYQIN